MAKATAVLLLIVGLAMVAGGGYLASLGGSLYYLLAGVAIAVSGLLIWRKRREGIWLFWAMLFATVGWAIAESGVSGWAWMPRLFAPTLVGLWLLLPWIRKATITQSRAIALGLAGIGVVLGLGLAATRLSASPAEDPLFQTGRLAEAPDAIPLREGNAAGDNWEHYGGDVGGSRFSTLSQITPENVANLEVAWTYRTGPKPEGYNTFEVTPIHVDGLVYLCTSSNDVIALDAETGRQVWRHTPDADLADVSNLTCRGVAHARVPDAPVCSSRIITNTLDARLIALDALTGERCEDFGENGAVSLLDGMGDVIKGYYYLTSAPAIVRDRIVLGGWVTDGQYWGEPSGVIRAFDVASGELAWAFDMGQPDRPGLPEEGETYTPATPNSWAPMSGDNELGLVYVPTGNATPDYFGAQRRDFDEAYTSSVVALDIDTGRPRWHFQTVHHDLWDYDVGSQPTLADVRTGGGSRAALVLPTKRGEVFVLDRATGEPIAAVEERAVSTTGGVPEDWVAPTQPFSVGMPSFRGADLTEASMWGLTPLDQLWCRIRFRQARYDGPLTPPGLKPSITYPGYLGGMDWGGVTVDRDRSMMIVNSNNMANYTHLITAEDREKRGMKPRGPGSTEYVGGAVPQAGTPYGASTGPFLSPLGVPCQEPPYGRITGVDLATGRVVWTRTLGTAKDSGPGNVKLGLPLPMGVPNLGGAITTRGGLTFISATQDRYLRAFETATGDLVWQSRLPAGGQATPATYASPESGRQFVVIAAGGMGLLKSKDGDYVVAFALPKDKTR